MRKSYETRRSKGNGKSHRCLLGIQVIRGTWDICSGFEVIENAPIVSRLPALSFPNLQCSAQWEQLRAPTEGQWWFGGYSLGLGLREGEQKENQPTLDQISWLRSWSQGLGRMPAARASDEATQPPGISHQGKCWPSFRSSGTKRSRVPPTPRNTDTFSIVLHLSPKLMGNHSIKTSAAEYIKPQYEFKKMKTPHQRHSEASFHEMKFCFIPTDFLGEIRWRSGSHNDDNDEEPHILGWHTWSFNKEWERLWGVHSIE